MEEWLRELRKKLVNLKSGTYGFAYSYYEKTDFQMWYREVNNIFKEYEFSNKLYEEDFNKLLFRNKKLPESLQPLQKPFFEKDLEEARKILIKIIQDIDIQ